MPSCETKYFGTIDFTEDALLTFPAGVLGFESETLFVLLNRPEQYPLVYLQSLATPDLCFLALPVPTIEPNYQIQIGRSEAALLQVSEQPAIGGEVLCLALVTAHKDTPTANLLAPIVINLHSRMAAQCLHADGWYSHQHPLVTEEETAAV